MASIVPEPNCQDSEGMGRDRLSSTSNRLQQKLIAHDIKGEKAIAVAQAAIACFVLLLHLLAQFSNGSHSFNLWVVSALAGLLVTSRAPR